MISQFSYEQVLKNLNKLGVKKENIKQIKLSDLYLNFSLRSDCNSDNEGHNIPFHWEYFFDMVESNEFINKNRKYAFYEDYKNTVQKYDFYLLKNDIFGYPSEKLDGLSKTLSTLHYFPNEPFHWNRGLKQTLLFVNKNPVDDKADFFIYYSQYAKLLYGDEAYETKDFIEKLDLLIKQIFGWPITNFLINKDIKVEKWSKSLYTIFNEYLEKNQITKKEMTIYQMFNDSWGSHQTNGAKHHFETCWEINRDYLFQISSFFIKGFGEVSFWKNSDQKYLKFFELDDEFLGIADISKNLINYNSEWSFDELIGREGIDNLYLPDKNIIFSPNIQKPILIWDQRGYQNLFYKIMLPVNWNYYYSRENTKKIMKNIFKKVNQINHKFLNTNSFH